MKNLNIPITKLYLRKEEESAVVDTIRSGWITQGPKVARFEKTVAQYVGAKYAIATSSCTTALHLALITSGVEPGDEVIVPSFSFIATANAVVYCGARPIFVDIDHKTYNLDINKIEPAITKKTKAILTVHQAGLASNMGRIMALAKKYKLKVVEDAACAIGSGYERKRIGSISELTCFSFHPRKLITTGEGGMITTNRKDYANLLRRLRDHGASVSDLVRHNADKIIFGKYLKLGFNYRMPDICAALGIIQMSRLEGLLKKRIYLANIYNNAFKDISFLERPYVPNYAKHNYQSYILRVDGHSPVSRDEIMKRLLKGGIATSRIMAIHLEPYYLSRYGEIRLPKTEKAVKQTMLIPLYPKMTREEQNYIIESVIRIVKGKE